MRETGYYWVKIKEGDAWMSVFYSKLAQCWSTVSTAFAPALSSDNEFFVINETRIKNPDESVGNKRLLELSVKCVIATGEQEGVWFGLNKDENEELQKLINEYFKP